MKNQTLVPYSSPQVPDEFDRSITWPNHRIGPDEPEFLAEDGPESYRSNHRAAWIECLECFYSDARFDNQPLWRTNESLWITVSGPNHWNDARLDGFHQCQSQLMTLLDTSTEVQLRDQLKRNVSQTPRVARFAIAGAVLGIIAGCAVLNQTSKTAGQ